MSQVPAPTSKYDKIREAVKGGYVDVRSVDEKEQVGLIPATKKENAAILFKHIQDGTIDVESLPDTVQQSLKKFLDDNGGTLEVDHAIDWKQYGIGSEFQKEKENLNKNIQEQKNMELIQANNSYNTQKTYHLDNSALIGIGIICVTLIIVLWMVLKNKGRQNDK